MMMMVLTLPALMTVMTTTTMINDYERVLCNVGLSEQFHIVNIPCIKLYKQSSRKAC